MCRLAFIVMVTGIVCIASVAFSQSSQEGVRPNWNVEPECPNCEPVPKNVSITKGVSKPIIIPLNIVKEIYHCDGNPYGGLILDACNVCGGDGSSCAGCDGIPYSGLTVDQCGVCGGNGDTCSDGSCPNDPQTVLWQGLEWQRCDSGKKILCDFGLEYANNYCQELVLGGHSDWRLPTWEELNTLVVCTNGHPVPLNVDVVYGQTCGDDGYSGVYSVPTIDPAFQCSEPYEYYCTSGVPPDAPVPFPEVIRFSDGKSEFNYGEFYVRCVRQP